jgi:hypothetical protein
LKRRLQRLLASTIVAAIPAHYAVAAPASEDVPVAGGRAALAAAFDIGPVPDRARFVAELARLIHGRLDRKPVPPEVLAAQLRRAASGDAAAGELVPIPLTAAVWSDAVFMRRVAAADIVAAILADRQAALLCHGLAALDDETLQYLGEHPSTLRQLYELAAEPFAVFSNSLRVRGDRIEPPGGGDAVELWEAVTGERVTRPDRFITALFGQADGRLAALYDAIGQLDEPRRRFALGLWIADPSTRMESMRALAASTAGAAAEWRVRTQPFLRQAYDLTSALTRIAVRADGRPAGPSARGFWTRAMAEQDLPADPAAELAVMDARPIDAAWLAGITAATDIRARAERLDQLAFGQRAFAAAAGGDAADVFVAVRAFRRYRMLMITLERLGIERPSLYAAAARAAARLASVDAARAFVATAQFQGSLAILTRMRMTGVLDAPRAEALVASLVGVPLRGAADSTGSFLRWMADELIPAIPQGPTIELSIQSAVAGPATSAAAAPRIEWEGQRYRFDIAAAERARIERIRMRQGGATLDMAFALASAAQKLAAAPVTLATVRSVADGLSATVDELAAEGRRGAFLDRDDFPPGVTPPPNVLDTLTRAVDELRTMTTDAALPRAGTAAANLAAAADEAAAQALVSLVYAVDLGDVDGSALLAGNVSRRHDFGFGQRDTAQRLRAAWLTPRQDVSPGVPWHIDGALLGLDVGMATVVLRRLSTDRALQAPTLSSNERETFAVGFATMNAFALTDAGQAALAAAIEAGTRRVRALRTAADVERLAAELNLDGWRRRALHWTAVNDAAALETFFSLRELLAAGGVPPEVDLDPWGTSAMLVTGCICTKMPAPGGLPLVTGRRQIGLLATAVPDLNLHVARTLFLLRLPAPLAKYVLSAAVLDFVEEVRGTDTDDWLALVRGAASVPRERIEDYVAAAAANGPLVPESAR